MNDSKRLLAIIAMTFSACANKPPPKADVPTAKSSSGPSTASGDSAFNANPSEVLALASPVSGPALDPIAPIPPRPVERVPIDLSSLTQPPRLELDARGHTSKVKALLFSHDGHFLVSAGYDKTVRVWSTASGELLRTLRGEIGEGPYGRIYAASLSQNDDTLAVAGWLGMADGQGYGSNRRDAYKIRILDFYSGNTLRLLEGHNDVVLSLACSHFGKRLVSGGGDRQAHVWNTATGQLERTLRGHTEGVSAVAFASDDNLVATGSLDRTVRLWDVNSGTQIAVLQGHADAVQALAFTPDGRFLVSGSLDRTLRLWDAHSGIFIKVLAQQESGVSSLSITPDGKRVVTGCADGMFVNHVFTIPEGQPRARFTGHDNIVLATAISPNGRWAATVGGSDYGIALWDVQTGREQIHMAGHGATVWSVGFGLDGNSIAWGNRFNQQGYSEYQINGPLQHSFGLGMGGTTLGPGSDLASDAGFQRAQTRVGGIELRTPNGREHPTLEIWENGRLARGITRDVTSGFDHRSYTLTPDGRTAVSGGSNGTLTAYDARSGAKLRDFVGHVGDVLALAVSPNGQTLVSSSADQTIRLWGVNSGALLATIFAARNGQWVAWTPVGYYASSAYGDTYVGWHINRGAAQTAAYFPVSSLPGQFRTDAVVVNFLGNAGDVQRAITLTNQGLADWQPKLTFQRFEDLPQFAPPSVTRMDPGVDVTVKGDRIEVSARAYSNSLEPITEIFFLINGRQVDERWWQAVGRPRSAIVGRNAEISGVLPLPEAINRISVVAKNRFNTGLPETIEVRRHGEAAELEKIFKPDLYLLSVGISNYEDPELQLRYADSDARSVAETLQPQAGKLYGKVLVRTLTERSATKSAVTEGLQWLGRGATQKDVAFIFLAGHAAVDERGNYFFLPHGGRLSDLSGTGVRWTEFQGILDRLPSKVVLLADTCHAASITGKTERSRGRPNRDLTRALRASINAGSGVVVMTAAMGVEESFEDDRWKHGAFTKALLEGLGGLADFDKDHAVYVRELDHYLTKRVNQLTEGRQHPSTEVPRSMPNFPIFYR